MALTAIRRVVKPVAPVQDPELTELVETYLRAQREESEARKTKDAAYKRLEMLLAQRGLERVEVTLGNRQVVAAFEAGEKRVVDKTKLVEKVGPSAFVEVATVSQSAVKEAFGAKLLAEVLTTVTEEPKLRIKEV